MLNTTCFVCLNSHLFLKFIEASRASWAVCQHTTDIRICECHCAFWGNCKTLDNLKFVKTKKIKLKHEMSILTHKYEVSFQITCYSRKKKLTRFIFPKFKNVLKNYRTSISSSAAARKIWFCNFAFTLQKNNNSTGIAISFCIQEPLAGMW